ncbi:hypothetical protein SKAU_G00078060 [Synaphobranchus kaupii]|uniref:Uncharacterized protein n=1 Tax=Synaphobranchus kaupii TaxID=118154 RepID=A0A9Q1FU30_SYNKA|nr:hypothetical protein SKAU_G00078060 [Synaphobranchus kaupii]
MALQTILLALTVLWAAAQTPPCRILGRAAKPSFYQHGDINIGGVFALHNNPSKISRGFDTKPESLKCSRESQFGGELKLLYLHLVHCSAGSETCSGMALQTILLALTVLWAAAQTPPCRILGRAAKPSFYQHGDINIGGVFTLHNIPSEISKRFDTKSEPLKCSR